MDSNVLLDLFTDDKLWGDWSATHLASAFDAGPVLINPLIYAELAVGFNRIEDLDQALPDRIERENLPWDAAFPAAGLSHCSARGDDRPCAPHPGPAPSP